MAKGLTIATMAVALLIFLLLLLDLTIKIPFRQASFMMDLVFVICAAGLGYLGWTCFRDLR